MMEARASSVADGFAGGDRADLAATAADVSARMHALAAEGRLLEAVAYAHPHAMHLDDPSLHRELARIRERAVPQARESARARGEWPPRQPDPFPGVTGIPETRAEAVTGDRLGGAILHHGCFIVRGLLDADVARTLAADVEMAFQGFDAWFDGRTVDPQDRWFQPYDFGDNDLAIARPWTRKSGGGVLAADSPAMLTRLAGLFRRHPIVDAIRDYLGEPPLLSAGKTVLRKVEPIVPGPFHQDGAFLGADARTVNVWIALSECGIDAPALEVVDRRLDTIIETGTAGADYYWSVSRDEARRANDGLPFARPTFKAGDALIFDQMMLHATSWSATMDRPRYAIEAWFFAPSAYTADQVPLVI